MRLVFWANSGSNKDERRTENIPLNAVVVVCHVLLRTCFAVDKLHTHTHRITEDRLTG